jgi:predicted NAD/FAD-dependent oxidoreductase
MDTFSEPVASDLCPRSVVVIGAGPAGLVAASRLHAAGVDVVIYEKSQGIGGRVATRRVRDRLAFDHGAQYVTARGESFARYLAETESSGFTARWDPVIDPPRARVAGSLADATTVDIPPCWYVGAPGMSSLFRPLASNVSVRHEITVTNVEPTDRGIWLTAIEPDRGPRRIGAFDAAIIAVPAPQAGAMTGHLPNVAEALARVVMTPCWALMLAVEGNPLVSADVYRRTSGPISWVARDASKPGRYGDVATLVVHASAEWSREHLEDSPDAVAAQLIGDLNSLVGTKLPASVYAVAHRWRYAQTAVPLGAPYLDAIDGRVLIGGDWTMGGRVEAAWDSGEAMAAKLLSL